MALSWQGPTADRAPSRRVMAMKERQRQAALETEQAQQQQMLMPQQQQHFPYRQQQQHPASAPYHVPPMAGGAAGPAPAAPGLGLGGPFDVRAVHHHLHHQQNNRGVSTLDTHEIEATLEQVRDQRQQFLLANATQTLGPRSPRSPPPLRTGAQPPPPLTLGSPHSSAVVPSRHHHHHQLSVIGSPSIGGGGAAAVAARTPQRGTAAYSEPTGRGLSPGLQAGLAVGPGLPPMRQHPPHTGAGVTPTAGPAESVLMRPMFQEACYCCGQRLRGRGDVSIYETARVLDALCAPLRRPAAAAMVSAQPTAPSVVSGISSRPGGPSRRPKRPEDVNLEGRPRWHP